MYTTCRWSQGSGVCCASYVGGASGSVCVLCIVCRWIQGPGVRCASYVGGPIGSVLGVYHY